MNNPSWTGLFISIIGTLIAVGGAVAEWGFGAEIPSGMIVLGASVATLGAAVSTS